MIGAIPTCQMFPVIQWSVNFRGGVEDTRPRTGMLEAKTKHTGASVLQKKVFKKFFQAIYKIERFKKYCCPRAEDRAIFEAKDVVADSTSCIQSFST